MIKEQRDPTKGGYYPDGCQTVTTTTQIKNKKTGRFTDHVFKNPPDCIFPFNYRGRLLLSININNANIFRNLVQ